MKHINVFWYRLKGHERNFGDELGPYIVNKLTGCKIFYIPIADTPVNIITHYFYGLLKGSFNINIIGSIIKSLFARKILVTVGSVLGRVKSKKCIIWGSGILQRNTNLINAKYNAVRGEITKARLVELNINQPVSIGDPAILLPLLYNPNSKKEFKLGIIPHYIHYNEFVSNYKNDDILIINLLDPIETVINNIISCEMTISSSLHGLIVSHAYNIPSLWYYLSEEKLAGDNIKFLDYFSSVGIIDYNPFLFTYQNEDIISIINNIQNNLAIATIQIKISTLQIGLLQSFPYKLLDNYKLAIIKLQQND